MLPIQELHWSWHQLTHSLWVCSAMSLVALDSYAANALCLMFDGFKEQKTEAPLWLAIYMLTRLQLDYVQYYMKHLHIADVLLMYYMFYLTTLPNSKSLFYLTVWCTHYNINH